MQIRRHLLCLLFKNLSPVLCGMDNYVAEDFQRKQVDKCRLLYVSLKYWVIQNLMAWESASEHVNICIYM